MCRANRRCSTRSAAPDTCSVPQTRFFETTAFRLTLLFSAVLSASVLILFTFIYWQTAGYLDRRLEDFVLREASIIAALPPERQVQWIEERLARPPPDGSPSVMRALARPAAGGRILVDGRSATELEEFEGRLIQAFGWAAGLAPALRLAGGAGVSLGSGRPLGAVHP